MCSYISSRKVAPNLLKEYTKLVRIQRKTITKEETLLQRNNTGRYAPTTDLATLPHTLGRLLEGSWGLTPFSGQLHSCPLKKLLQNEVNWALWIGNSAKSDRNESRIQIRGHTFHHQPEDYSWDVENHRYIFKIVRRRI